MIRTPSHMNVRSWSIFWDRPQWLYRLPGTGYADRSRSGGLTMGRSDLRRCHIKEEGGGHGEGTPEFRVRQSGKKRKGLILRMALMRRLQIHIYDEMIGFARYAFNQSHAACYAVVSYQTAYLKYLLSEGVFFRGTYDLCYGQMG